MARQQHTPAALCPAAALVIAASVAAVGVGAARADEPAGGDPSLLPPGLASALRATLTPEWSVDGDTRVRVTTWLHGWSTGKHCFDHLSRSKRDLDRALVSFAAATRGWAAAHQIDLDVTLEITGRSDALSFGSRFVPAACASALPEPPGLGDDARLGWHRAASTGDAVIAALRAGGVVATAIVRGERDPEGRVGRQHRGVLVVLTVSRRPSAPPVVPDDASTPSTRPSGAEGTGPSSGEAPLRSSPTFIATSMPEIGRNRGRLVGIEADLGVMAPLRPSIYRHLYRATALVRFGACVRVGGAHLRSHLVLAGGRSNILFNTLEQPQLLGGAGFDADLAFPIERRVSAGARAGALFLYREIARSDLPISLPERQHGTAILLGGFVQGHAWLSRRVALTAQISIDHMLLELNDDLVNNFDARLLGGISHAFD